MQNQEVSTDPYFAEIDMYLSEIVENAEEPMCEKAWCTGCPYYQSCLAQLDVWQESGSEQSLSFY